LLVSELTGFVANKAMKTAGKENQNSCATAPSNRAHGAAGQNRSCSMKWAAKVEKFQPRERFFFLTFPFIEQTRSRLDYPSPFDKRQNGSVHGKIHAHGIC
jgi:hypothetical protein